MRVLIISGLAINWCKTVPSGVAIGDIIYKENWLNVWLLRKLFVILQRFFAPIGPKMMSKRLIA